jgi:apolipoprotein N-acyltransferase
VPVIASISTVTGVFGVSFFIVLVNTAIALIISGKSGFFIKEKGSSEKNRIKFGRYEYVTFFTVTILFILAGLYGIFTSPTGGEGESFKVAVVQGNVEVRQSHDRIIRNQIFNIYEDMTLEAAESRPDIIVWPAASVPGGIPYNTRLVKKLADLAVRTKTHLLVGSSGYEKYRPDTRDRRRIANSAFLFDTEGEMAGRYDKIILLPFDEYLPMRGKVRWPKWIADPEMIDSRPGEELTIFTIGNWSLGVQICWENLFPGQFRKFTAKKLDFMVSMTNEAFVADPSAHYQMLAMNVFRAIENRISIVRCAPTGISTLIDPSGRMITSVSDEQGREVNIAGYTFGEIPLTRTRTFYNRTGDWFVLISFLMLLFPAALFLLRRGPG